MVERLDAAQQVEVETYLANDDFVDESLKPFDWYQALVVAGAMQHGLPNTYSAKLRAAGSLPDPDPDRRDRELDFLGDFRSHFDNGILDDSRRSANSPETEPDSGHSTEVSDR